MRAVEITEPGGPDVLVLGEREKPTPGIGQVLIKVEYAGVNRPDVVQRMGLYPPPPGASDIPGLEVSGTIEAVGTDVTEFTVGDEVCALVPGGGYAEYCVADTESTLRVPAGLGLEKAAATPETYFTVWSNLFDRAGLKQGETLLVHGGSSGIGTTAILLAKAFGARVITTVGSEKKVEYCRNLGADLVINYKTQDFFEETETFAGKLGVNVVLDMVGGDYIQKNIDLLAPDGRHVSIAFLGGPKTEINMLPVMLKRLTLTGSTLRARDKSFKGAIASNLKSHVWPLMESGKAHPHIHTVLPLADASKAHAMMEESSHMGKILLKVP
jgi:putative PIG3 family NAD(P)H quinone oxidoreductase